MRWRHLNDEEFARLSPDTRAAYLRFWKRQRKKTGKKAKRVQIPEFFASLEWKRVRYEVLKRSHGRCECCGAGPAQGAVLNVDHIKPRLKFPKLALDVDNLQVLCAACNQGKGDRDRTDWRKPVDVTLDIAALADLRDRGLLN